MTIAVWLITREIKSIPGSGARAKAAERDAEVITLRQANLSRYSGRAAAIESVIAGSAAMMAMTMLESPSPLSAEIGMISASSTSKFLAHWRMTSALYWRTRSILLRTMM